MRLITTAITLALLSSAALAQQPQPPSVNDLSASINMATAELSARIGSYDGVLRNTQGALQKTQANLTTACAALAKHTEASEGCPPLPAPAVPATLGK